MVNHWVFWLDICEDGFVIYSHLDTGFYVVWGCNEKKELNFVNTSFPQNYLPMVIWAAQRHDIRCCIDNLSLPFYKFAAIGFKSCLRETSFLWFRWCKGFCELSVPQPFGDTVKRAKTLIELGLFDVEARKFTERRFCEYLLKFLESLMNFIAFAVYQSTNVSDICFQSKLSIQNLYLILNSSSSISIVLARFRCQNPTKILCVHSIKQ